MSHNNDFIERQLLRINRKFSGKEEYKLLVESYNQYKKELEVTKGLLKTLRKDYQDSEAENRLLRKELHKLQAALDNNNVVTKKTHEKALREINELREELADLRRPIIKAQIEKQNAELRELLLNQKQNVSL